MCVQGCNSVGFVVLMLLCCVFCDVYVGCVHRRDETGHLLFSFCAHAYILDASAKATVRIPPVRVCVYV